MKIPSNNPFTESHYKVLKGAADLQYFVSNQMQRYSFPHHKQGRSTRKLLTELLHWGCLNKKKEQVTWGQKGNGAPVWYLTQKGRSVCADHFQNEAYLRASTRAPRSDLLHHWVHGITETNLRFRQGIAAQDYIKLHSFIPEWTRYHPGNEGAGGFYLHTKLRSSPPLSCSPDFALVLEILGYIQVIYGEADMATAGNLERQFAARKAPGYHELARQGIAKSEHFPTLATDGEFSILTVTTTPYRRDRMAESIQKHPGKERWLFAAAEDITGDPSMFFEPILRTHEGRLRPFAKKPVAQPVLGPSEESAA